MQDILLDNNYEVKLKDGDFIAGFSDNQQKELLLICNKGSFKENPASCVGLWNFLEAEDPSAMVSEIKLQFKSDGMEIIELGITGGKLFYESYYP